MVAARWAGRQRYDVPNETQFAIVVYRRRWNGFLILLCSLALLFPPPATGSGHSRASLCLSRGPSLYHPPDALGPPVSQAKYAPCASCPEVGPGRYIVIKDQRKTPCICMVFFFGIGWLPIFPTQFRNGRAALRVEALPCAPLLIGCSPPCIRHRRRSAPSHLQPSNTLRVS